MKKRKEKKRVAEMSYSARNILRNIDTYMLKATSSNEMPDSPPIIKMKPFSGHTLKSKLANMVSLIPLRIIRKSTTEHYFYQAQVNQEFREEIELLHKRIDLLNDKEGSLK